MLAVNADIREALREARALLEEWRRFPDSVHVWCAAGHDLVRRTDAVLDASAWAIDEGRDPGGPCVIRKGLAYWTGAGWSFRPAEALAIALDEARRLRDELRARCPGEGPEFDPRVEPAP